MNGLIEQRLVLDLCGGTGAWSAPYRDAGYPTVIVDPAVDGSDVRLFHKPAERVYGILAAPPCTMFAVSGARWKRSDDDYRQALSIVDACLRLVYACRPVFWALENPVGILRRWIGPPVMYFQPCDFGDPWTKKTCLWGDFNEPKKNPVEPTQGSKIHRMPPSEDRQRLRSITPPGFAKAFFEANR